MKQTIQFPICATCGNRHYRKAGKPCRFIGLKKPTRRTTDVECKGIRCLNDAERHGFACNTPECPCGADYGKVSVDSPYSHDVSDVRCRDCALERGWITEEIVEKNRGGN